MMEMTVNYEAFNKSAEALLAESERTYPHFINGQALAVAIRARKYTQKTEKESISQETGQIDTTARTIKRGKRKGQVVYKKVYNNDEDSLLARIVNSRRRDAGLPMIWGAQLQAEVIKARNARLRAAGFIRSAWGYAINMLAKAVRAGQRARGYVDFGGDGELAKMSGQPKGGAEPATPVLSGTVVAEIWNSALIKLSDRDPHHIHNPLPIAQHGLQRALDETAKDMEEELARRLQPIFDKAH